MVKLFILFFMLIAASCSNKMGITKYGPDRKVESATSKSKCTRPRKTYAKGFEAAVQRGTDSLVNLPSSNIDLQVKQTITRLADYSSDGLDFALVQFIFVSSHTPQA